MKKLLLLSLLAICCRSLVFAQTVTKQLYLSSPGQALDRVDPVATGDITTATTNMLSVDAPGVVVDAVSTKTSFTSPISQAHTTGTGLNRLMLVGISQKNKTVTSVTYGGVPLTLVGENNINGNARIAIYRLLNPASGSANVVVNFSANPDKGAVIGIMTFSDVDQITPLGTFATDENNTANPTVNVASAAGELVFNVVSLKNKTITVGAGHTQRWNLFSGGEIYGGASTTPGAAPTTTVNWTAASTDWSMGAVSIKPAPVYTSATFIQAPVLCSDLTITNSNIVVTAYVSVLSGSMPASPNITAVMKYGTTTIVTLTNPTYNSGTGLLTWTGTPGANITVPAGQAIQLDITTAQSGVRFTIDFDSQTKPSKISFQVSTFINVNSVGVYSAAYPAGSLLTNSVGGTVKYLRAVVSDPFGAADITGLDFTITPPGTSVAGNSVATIGCTRIYEYTWTTPLVSGSYTISAIAREGFENAVTHSNNTLHSICLDCPPGALNDSASGSGGSPISISVLVNDYDPNNNLNPSSLSIITQPNNGTAYLVDDRIVYLPNGSFSGKDTITYQVCDLTSPTPLCTTAQVYITIDPFVIDICADAIKVHTYYIPYPEQDAYTALKQSTSGSMPSNNIRTVISIKAPYPGMTVVWDEWEDGYETNSFDPQQSTTKVWGDGNPYNGIAPGFPSDIIPAGGSIILDNTMPANPRVSSNIFYDGKDKITSNGQIAMTQVSGEPANIAVQVIKTNITSVYDFGKSFTIPMGENFNSQDFKYTSLFIRASVNNTSVSVDKDNNGTFETTTVLNEGACLFINGGVLTGATIASDKLVGVELHAGGVDNFSVRNAPIFPATWYSHTYYSPVPTSSVSSPKDTSVVMLYNSLNRAININWYSGVPSSGVIEIPAKSAVRFPLVNSTTAAYKFVNLTGESFTAIEIVDSYTPGGGGNTGSTYDWAFNLISEPRLTDFATVAWAPGSLDGSRNDNPIWVTPNQNTTLYVKYDGNILNGPSTSPCGLKYDVAITLNALNYAKIKDPNDNDQSGIAIYTCDGAKIAAVYGEDPSTAVPGSPSWDVGATIQPFCKQKLIFAKNDYARTLVNQPVTISVLLNDVGFLATINPATLSTAGLIQPKFGSVKINTNGTILYTPAPGYIGMDTLEYMICSTPSPVVCAKATVYVQISGCPADNNRNIISGQVFGDRNKDGIKNDNGTGFPQIKVYLYADGNCNGVINTNERIDSVTVDSSGYYQFVRYPEKIISDNFDNGAGASSCATGTDGNTPWTASWTDAGDPSTGFCNTGQSAANTDAEIINDIGFGFALRLKDNDVSAQRMINLNGVTKAFLSFSYRKKSTTLIATDQVFVQSSTNGTTYTTLFTITGNGTIDSAYVPVLNQEIPGPLTSTTYIRILTNSNMSDNDTLYIDDVSVRYLNYPACYISGIDPLSVPSDSYVTTTQQRTMTFNSTGSCSSLADFGLAKNSITISGKLVNDNNGLKDNNVNGPQIDNMSGSTVYVYLSDISGVIVNKTTVIANGTYSFTNADVNSSYLLMMSTDNLNVYDPTPSNNVIPSNWKFTGEEYGHNNSAGSGIEAGMANGIMNVTTSLPNVTNVNMSAQRLPDSDNKLYFMSTPVVNSYMTLNGSGLMPGPLSGTDPEDGVLGANTNLHIISLPSGNHQLYYNSVRIIYGADVINPPSNSNPFVITNYNPALLSLRFTGLGTTFTEFNYDLLDAADMRKLTYANYRIDWQSPLPVKLISFNATLRNSNIVDLTWETASEINLDHFIVERSTDGVNFNEAGTINARGNATDYTDYSLADNIASVQSGVIYYRLRSMDIDRKSQLSEIRIIKLTREKNLSIIVYPNPVSNELRITIPSDWQNKKVIYQLVGVNGQPVTTVEKVNSSQTETINVSKLPIGTYFVIVKCNGITAQQKIIKQ